MPPPDVRLNVELTTLPDAKGEFHTQNAARTTRYFPGQAPAYADADDDDEDDLSTILQRRNAAANAVEEVVEEDVQKMDSDSDEDDEVERRRAAIRARRSQRDEEDEKEEEAEDSEPKEEDHSPEHVTRVVVAEVVDDSDSEDEEEIAKRRAAIRARRLQREAEEAAAAAEEEEAKEEDDEEGEESDEESEWETDSEDEDNLIAQTRLKPKFVPRTERETIHEQERKEAEQAALEEKAEQDKEERKKESHKMLEDELRKGAIEDNEISDTEMPDDDDDMDEEEQYNIWKFRELERVLDEKEAREAQAKEAAEILRRRNLTDEERATEDAADKERQHRLGKMQDKGKWGFMQKYYHKGAFFQDTNKHGVSEYDELFNRDYGGATLEDHFDKSSLPAVLQVKKFGHIGQTKYTHLKDQDTTVKEKDQGWGADAKLREKYLGKRAGIGDVERPSKKGRTG